MTAGTALALCSLLAAVPTSLAASPLATLDSPTPALEIASDGSAKATLGLTNITDREVSLGTAPATAREGCALTPSSAELPAAQHSEVTVSVPAACAPREGVTMVVSLTGEGQAEQTFTVNPAAEPTAEALDWNQLWAFPIALGASLLLALLIYLRWSTGNPKADGGLSQPLIGLGATWSFNDNWVTNVTAVGALLTGVFGTTDAIKAFLGEDAETSIALASIAGAVALALVAAGPIVLLSTKSYKEVGTPPKRGDAFSIGGFLAGAATVLASAFGQLWVIRTTGSKLDMGGLEGSGLWILAVLAALLLLLYAVRVLPDLLTRGVEEPPPTPSPVDGAVLIAAALKAKSDVDDDAVDKAVEEVRKEFPAPAEAPPQGEYSALI